MSDLDDFGSLTDQQNYELKKIKKKSEPTVSEKGEEEEANPKKSCGGAYSQWTEVEDYSYQACGSTLGILPSGIYKFQWWRGRPCFCGTFLKGDNLIDFEDSIFSKVINEIENFWKLGDVFKEYGFLHKRGYLFFGPAGSGKSCLIQRVLQNVFSKGGIAFLCSTDPNTIADSLRIFRMLEENRPIICIYEDLDVLIDEHTEDGILSLLDGETQIDHVINLATTNYPERLDKRIVSRPRRFDRIIKIETPDERIRKIYLKNKLNMNGELTIEQLNELNEWVAFSEGFSFAAMAEMVVSVKCLGNSLEETVKRLRELMVKKPKFGEEEVGFK